MTRNRRGLALLFTANIFLSTIFYATYVFIPLFIRNLNASVFEVGIVLFISNASATFTMILSGYLSDKYGRRKIIVLSGIIQFITPLPFMSAKKWVETIIYASLNIISVSLFVSSRAAMIIDLSERESAGEVFGLMNTAWPIGGLIGPFVGGLVVDRYGWNFFFYFICALATPYLLIGLFLPESAKRLYKAETGKTQFSLRQIASTLAFFIILHIIANMSVGALSTVLPFYLTEQFGKTKTEVGIFFSVGTGLAALISQPSSGFLSDKIGRKKIIAFSILPIPILYMLFTATNDYLLSLLVYMGIYCLWSATWPASNVYIAEIFPHRKRGLAAGIRLTSVRLGTTIGPLMGGFLWDNFDIHTVFHSLAIFMAIALLMALMLKDESKFVNSRLSPKLRETD